MERGVTFREIVLTLDALEHDETYSLEELQAWLATRSRLCSTNLWKEVLAGREAFEIGDYTYFLRGNAGGYRVSRVVTAELIQAGELINSSGGGLLVAWELLKIMVRKLWISALGRNV